MNQLMKQVYETGFALDDIILYLDTHPCDTGALNYYQQAASSYNNAVAAYEAQCGPLTINRERDRNYWNWLDNPWPWEGGCE